MSHPSPNFIKPDQFGKDHRTTFLYVETKVTDTGRFKLSPNPHMRTHRHNWRLASRRLGAGFGDKYGTRLRDGGEQLKHDDWDCVQDLAEAGFLTIHEHEPMESGDILHQKNSAQATENYGHVTLTDAGWSAATALRKHRAEHGNTSAFVWPIVEPSAE